MVHDQTIVLTGADIECEPSKGNIEAILITITSDEDEDEVLEIRLRCLPPIMPEISIFLLLQRSTDRVWKSRQTKPHVEMVPRHTSLNRRHNKTVS